MKNIFLSLLLFSVYGFSQIYNPQKLNALARQYEEKYKKDLAQLKSLKNARGQSLNEEELAAFVGLTDGIPLYITNFDTGTNFTSNIDLARTSTINGQTLNLTGTGQTLYLWEISLPSIQYKVNTTTQQPTEQHVDFASRLTIASGQAVIPPYNQHATAVTGVAIGNGSVNSAYVGVAPVSNAIAYDFTNGYSEIAAATAATVSNHSYGVTTGWGQVDNQSETVKIRKFYGNLSANSIQSNWSGIYTSNSRAYDEIAYNNPNHLMVKAVGNGGDKGPVAGETLQYSNNPLDTTPTWIDFTASDTPPLKNCDNGYDCLTADGASKNILLVQAVNKLTTRYSSPSQVIKSSFGSVGPRDDGAIKPDISAVGVGVNTTGYTTNTSYLNNVPGTSFSAPIISGIALLMQELWAQKGYGVMRSDVARGILTHTANEAGANPGPDPIFGWGLADALKAVTCIMNRNTTSRIDTYDLANGANAEYTYTASGSVPLRVSLVWIDPPGISDNINTTNNDRTSKIINDLDVVVEKVSDLSTTFPWKIDPNNPSAAATQGVNTADNIEQVHIETPQADAQYKVKISHKGTLTNGSQKYALIITGVKDPLATDTPDIKLEDRIMVSPNPARNHLFIKLPQEVKNTSLEIYDLGGKLVKTFEPFIEEAGIIEIEDLLSGNYILKIGTNKETISKLFIKK